MLLGRVVNTPRVHVFPTGGKVWQCRISVDAQRKNQDTGEWEDCPMVIDVKAFNRRGANKQLADMCEEALLEGSTFFLEGKLIVETWREQNGANRDKHVVEMNDFTVFASP